MRAVLAVILFAFLPQCFALEECASRFIYACTYHSLIHVKAAYEACSPSHRKAVVNLASSPKKASISQLSQDLDPMQDWTPIMIAVARLDVELLAWLLSKGADPCLYTRATSSYSLSEQRRPFPEASFLYSGEQAEEAGHTTALHLLSTVAAYRSTVDKTIQDDAVILANVLMEATLHSSCLLDATSSKQETALHYAIRHGQIALSRVLLKHGANVLIRNLQGRTVLHLAAKRNSELVALLLENSRERNKLMQVQDADGQTALHYAVRAGIHQSVGLLIKAGLKDSLDKMGNDAVTLAVWSASRVHQRQGDLTPFKKMIEFITSKNQLNYSFALFLAIEKDLPELAGLILPCIKDLKVKKENKTLVEVASLKGDISLMKKLLSLKAPIETSAVYNLLTPRSTPLPHCIESFSLLHSHLNWSPTERGQALAILCQSQSSVTLDLLHILLQKPINWTATELNTNQIPLLIQLAKWSTDPSPIATVLLNSIPTKQELEMVNARSANNNSTVLIESVCSGHGDYVSLLIEHGANTLGTDGTGKSAMDYATSDEMKARLNGEYHYKTKGMPKKSLTSNSHRFGSKQVMYLWLIFALTIKVL